MKLTIYKFVAVVFFGFLFCINTLFAQQSVLFGNNDQEENVKTKAFFGLGLGASYLTGYGNQSILSQSASPFFQWNATSRLSLLAGGQFSLFQFGYSQLPFTTSLSGEANNNYLSLTGNYGFSAFIAGEYKATEKLTVFGSSWITYNNWPGLNTPFSFTGQGFFSKGATMGLEYRLSDKFSFGAGFSVAERNNPLLLQQGLGYFGRPAVFGPRW